MPVIHHPPGTPLPDNHPFAKGVIIFGGRKPAPARALSPSEDQSPLAPEPSSVHKEPSATVNLRKQSTSSQLELLKLQLADLEAEHGPDNPFIQGLKAQIIMHERNEARRRGEWPYAENPMS